MEKRIVIVGGGATGLFAAAHLGDWLPETRILLLEKGPRVGRKLAATGNGRCNFANARPEPGRFHSVDDRPDGLRRREETLAAFPLEDSLEAWRRFGVQPVEEERGKLYPASGQASAMLDLLRIECERRGIESRCEQTVTAVSRPEGEERIRLELAEGATLYADAVLLATGGEASPKLGGATDGYRLLEALGHSITPRYPAIAPLETDTQPIRILRGCKVQGALTLFQGEKPLRREDGEILFTEYGLSGPPALQLAEALGAAQLADPKAALTVAIDVLLNWPYEDLLLAMQLRLAEQGYRRVEDFMTGWLHKQVARASAKAAGIQDLGRSGYSLSAGELERWAALLKGWRLAAMGSRGMAQAQVTAGGAALADFSGDLQSRRLPGLFACGELLDVHGDSGGFNLQWAWSSAIVAARGITGYLQ